MSKNYIYIKVKNLLSYILRKYIINYEQNFSLQISSLTEEQQQQQYIDFHYKEAQKLYQQIKQLDPKFEQYYQEWNSLIPLYLKPIAFVYNKQYDKFEAPRQSGYDIIKEEVTIIKSKQDLKLQKDQYYIIQFIFDRNYAYRNKCLPPKLKNKRVGFMSSRTPNRFNPIGQSIGKCVLVDCPQQSATNNNNTDNANMNIVSNNVNTDNTAALSGKIDIATKQSISLQYNTQHTASTTSQHIKYYKYAFTGLDLLNNTPIINFTPYQEIYQKPDATFGWCQDENLLKFYYDDIQSNDKQNLMKIINLNDFEEKMNFIQKFTKIPVKNFIENNLQIKFNLSRSHKVQGSSGTQHNEIQSSDIQQGTKQDATQQQDMQQDTQHSTQQNIGQRVLACGQFRVSYTVKQSHIEIVDIYPAISYDFVKKCKDFDRDCMAQWLFYNQFGQSACQ